MVTNNKDLKKPVDKILSDSEVNRLYEKLQKEQQTSPSKSTLRSEGHDIPEAGHIVKDVEKIESKSTESMTDKTTEIVGKTKPVLNKMKHEVKDEVEDFVNESTEKIKNTSKSLKRFGSKYFEKTKKELTEGENYFKENIPNATTKLKEEIDKNSKSIKEGTTKMSSQTKNSFLDSVERMYGASTVGKQYGQTSAQLLREVGELRKAGLITQKEYDEKKDELLKRI